MVSVRDGRGPPGHPPLGGLGLDDARLEPLAAHTPHQHATDQAARRFRWGEGQEREQLLRSSLAATRRSIGRGFPRPCGYAVLSSSGRLPAPRHTTRTEIARTTNHERSRPRQSGPGTAPRKRAATRPPGSSAAGWPAHRSRPLVAPRRHECGRHRSFWRRDKHQGHGPRAQTSGLRQERQYHGSALPSPSCCGRPARNPFRNRPHVYAVAAKWFGARRVGSGIGWETGIRTPIPWSRAMCPTVGRSPKRANPDRSPKAAGFSNLRIIRHAHRHSESVAEFLGTFVLIAFGTGVVAEVVLSGSANGSTLSIHLAWVSP